MKYRLHYISDVEGWAYWWIGLALQKHAPKGVAVTIGTWQTDVRKTASAASGADVVLNMVYQGAEALADELRIMSPDTLLISQYNVGYQRGAERYLPWMAATSTHVVCNNRDTWCRAITQGLLHPERSSFISVGTDPDIYRISNPVEERKSRLLFCCSIGHAAWKGAAILDSMRGEFEARGHECDFVVVDSHGKKRMDRQQLSDWYNSGTIYLCLSEPGHEGTPMPPLEAAACGCAVITTETGSMPELVRNEWNGIIIKDRNPSTIMNAVELAASQRMKYAANMQSSLREWYWPERAMRHFELCDRLLSRCDNGQ